MTVAQACSEFGISRQAHYQQRQREVERSHAGAIVLEMVRQVRRKHPRMGGRKLLHKIQPMLSTEGVTMGRDRLFDLLREHSLLVQRKKSFRRTTVAGWWRAPNRLPGLMISRPNQVWVCDITYLELEADGFAYLFVLMDLFSRYIVGWHVAPSLAAEGALCSLQKALTNLATTCESVIHHSDHGVQYTSNAYMSTLLEHHLLASMGAVGNCYDNIFAERLIGILKNEYLLSSRFVTFQQVNRAVPEVIHLYNTDRPHLSLEMATPEEVYLGACRRVPTLLIPKMEFTGTES